MFGALDVLQKVPSMCNANGASRIFSFSNDSILNPSMFFMTEAIHSLVEGLTRQYTIVKPIEHIKCLLTFKYLAICYINNMF